ncbi:MAG: hypothetical protein CMG74_05035 [Candidatus Marinimicrobia bacterium]|nr:hypothetical protein [Candidatus Neomarinimicrobiota bacterium]
MEFEGGRLKMLGIIISKDTLNISGRTLSQLAKLVSEKAQIRFVVVAVLRGQDTLVPQADFVFQEKDIAYFIVKSTDVRHLMEFLGREINEVKRVMIIGGSKIGRSLAKILPINNINVRLVDYNRPKAGHISHKLDDSMVIYGDGTDIEFLKSENIQDVDSLIAVTENEKTNLIAGLLANHLGAKQSIMHVVTTQYIRTIQEIGVGAVISKNLSTVNAILKKLHSDLSEIHTITFDEIDVDVVELQPDIGSLITQKPIKDLDFPKDSIVGMINHNGNIRIAQGSSQLTPEDTALVFTKPKSINKLKNMFDA